MNSTINMLISIKHRNTWNQKSNHIYFFNLIPLFIPTKNRVLKYSKKNKKSNGTGSKAVTESSKKGIKSKRESSPE